MKRQQWAMLAAVLVVIGATAGVLLRMKNSQKLGRPGVKTSTMPGSRNLGIALPERVLEFQSQPVETPEEVAGALPRDTSFGQRLYSAPDDFQVSVNVVLMGSDRTSLHKPQFCLTGAGWAIGKTELTAVPMTRPRAYDLPVMKLTTRKEGVVNGQHVRVSGVYVYWFVAEDALTAQHWQRMWWMAKELLRTGVLQRWAYVTCFSICPPGQEEATFNRMREFMAAAVPELQLTPQAGTPPDKHPAHGRQSIMNRLGPDVLPPPDQIGCFSVQFR